MTKKSKSEAIIKLLKKGYSPREVTQRMNASYNYAWKLKKDLEKAVGEGITEAKRVVGTVERKVAGGPATVIRATMEDRIEKILNTRATTYGRFADVAEIAQEIKATIRIGETNRSEELPADQSEALDMIASKIARILSGDSNYADSWVDIAGYAQLVVDRLQGKVR